MGWTDAQKKVIEENHKSLLVSAAAGSGKTSVLVAKVMELLKKDNDLSKMLIVTFTNAAAGEMKERISKELGPSYVKHSHICTFHKFAIDVIQQYYQIIGVNPSLTICDEYRQSIIKKEALDEMFEELFNADDKDFIYFLNCYASAKSSQNVREMILELHTFLESLPNGEEFLSQIKDGRCFNIKKYEEYSVEFVIKSLNTIINSLSIAYDMLKNPGIQAASPMPKLYAKVSEDIVGLQKILDDIKEKGISAFYELNEFSFVRLSKTKEEGTSFVFIESKFDMLRKNAKKAFNNLATNFGSLSLGSFEAEEKEIKRPLSILANLTENFIQRYQAKKQKKNLVDFSDIEHYALKILENNDVCEELKKAFDYIFVDEYQDSNLVQDELISRISRDDNVVMVGDVKQSIYKFRLAEPELFLNRYDLYKSGKLSSALAIDLNSNFRSKAPVIDFINNVFSRLMTKESVGLDYNDDAALKEGAKYTGDKVYRPVLNLISCTAFDGEEVDEEIEELNDAQLEALSAVNTIKEYYGKIIYDAKAKIERPLKYKDMVILLRSTKSRGEIFYKALEDAGIPVYLERGEGYFDTPEIQLLINLLKIIDNFRQDLSLIGVLSFPSFGFSPEELATIRIFSKEQGKGDISFSDAFVLYSKNGEEKLREKCLAFLNKIDEYRKKAISMPLSEFIWDILSESSIGIYARALPLGAQRYANLRSLAEKAESFEEQNGGGLFGFVSYIEQISKGDKAVETGQVTVLSEGADCVRIMTIHKSKGLEFPFVLLAGLSSKFMSSKNSLHLDFHKDFGSSIRLVEPKKGIYVDPLSLALIQQKKKEEDFAEIIRVLYVAMTRAKDILIMSAVTKDFHAWMDKRTCIVDASACINYLDMIGPILSVTDIHPVSLLDIVKGTKPSDMENKILSLLNSGFAVDETKLPISSDQISQRLCFDYAPDAESLCKHKYSVSEITNLTKNVPLQKQISKSYAVPLFAMDKLTVDAAAKGTAYHKVMELIPFTCDNKELSDIKEFISSLEKRNLLTHDEAKAIDARRIKAFFESEIGKRATKAKEVFKEKSFTLKTTFNGREVYVQGTIDCFFEEDDKYILLDYKSNYINMEELESEKQRLIDNYIPQLELYKKALEVITGKTVKEAVLYLFGINDTIKIC